MPEVSLSEHYKVLKEFEKGRIQETGCSISILPNSQDFKMSDRRLPKLRTKPWTTTTGSNVSSKSTSQSAMPAPSNSSCSTKGIQEAFCEQSSQVKEYLENRTAVKEVFRCDFSNCNRHLIKTDFKSFRNHIVKHWT